MRFVAGADGSVVPSLKPRLRGRGVWSRARRHLVEEAVRRRLFGRSFKADVRVSAELADELDRLLERSALNALSIAHKPGLVVLGFAKVQPACAESPPEALIRPRDSGEKTARRLPAPTAA